MIFELLKNDGIVIYGYTFRVVIHCFIHIFFELLKYTREQISDARIGILGNPELLTEEVIERLKNYNLYSYQVSLDGLEKTHDYLRYPGSFRITLEKIRLLNKYGIESVVMTTVSKVNLEELPSLVDVIVENEVKFYGFKRFVPIGEGEKIKEMALISPSEFRKLLEEMYRKYEENKDFVARFGEGEPLWKLFQYEEGLFVPPEDKNLVWGGCGIGVASLTVLEDGTALACRRLPIPVGKLPEQSIKDIFIFSEELNRMREYQKIEKCRNCVLFPYCRGCRAVAYAISGDYFKKDPQCWRK